MSSNITDQLSEKIENEYAKIRKDIKKPNVLIIGGTGVGKSSLVNAIFGKEIAKSGTGKPVTESMNVYKSDDVSVVLYDTVGYEIGTKKQNEFLTNVVNFASDSRSKPMDEQIHLIWYCIAAANHRIHDVDIEIIRKLNEQQIPVAIVCTKSDLVTTEEGEQLINECRNANLSNKIFETTHEPIDSSDWLDNYKLIDWSIEELPQGLRFAFISAQKLNLGFKKEEAKKVILQHSSGALAIGASPIPFSDAPLLLVNQAGMFARIMYIYDMETLLPMVKGLVGSIGIGTLISTSGIWLVGQLLKLIPGVGTVAGAMISASVATSITAAIGFGLSEICYRINEYVLNGKEEDLKSFMENMDEFFKDFVIKNLKKNSVTK